MNPLVVDGTPLQQSSSSIAETVHRTPVGIILVCKYHRHFEQHFGAAKPNHNSRHLTKEMRVVMARHAGTQVDQLTAHLTQ